MASLAPLVFAVVLWAVTRSPFALLFAALGPITAIASYVDSRLGGRRRRRQEDLRFAREVESALAEVGDRHTRERAALDEVVPAAAMIADRIGADPYRWSGDGDIVGVTLGRGVIPSGVQLDRPARGTPVDAALDDLERGASRLDDAPVIVDARLGIGVCGPPVLAAALARAIGLQLAWRLSPASHWLSAGEQWVADLPHAAGRQLRRGLVIEAGAAGSSDPVAVVAVAAGASQLPGSCRVVVEIGAAGATIIQHPDPAARTAFRPGLLSSEQAVRWARQAMRDAERDGIVLPAQSLPEVVQLGPLLRDGVTDRANLACEFAVSRDGPLALDLVADGPHAVVGGTTGSGKSELLVSWVLAMAAAHPPDHVTFLLVDFKGGSAFAALEELPHTVGIITDLDEEQATRALASLSAELRHRERALAAVGAKDITGTAEPRLVIVVDEFAAMLADHPDLHTLFADIAARGRSLGVHLVLCTQRPAGVVRDSVLANADLRISLRVNNRGDSTAVVGTDAAAVLPASARGRGIIAPAGAEPASVQFAIASPADVDLVAGRWTGSPRRPWCEPLPEVVSPADAAGGFGLVDLPEQQRREPARWSPVADGHLLILGAPRSGKSTALDALGVQRLPTGVAAAWDALADLDRQRDRLVAIDDLDSLLARFPADHREAFVERLGAVLRDGPARGIHLAVTAQRLTADVQHLAGLIPERLMLRHASRQEYVIAGGDGSHYRQKLPAGGGVWRGSRVQVALAPVGARDEPPVRVAPPSGRPLAIVSGRAAVLDERLRAAGLRVIGFEAGPGAPAAVGEGAVLLADVEEWQSRWGAVAALRPVADILFDGCSIADYRALTRSRELPPPLTGLTDVAWRLENDGSATRVAVPG